MAERTISAPAVTERVVFAEPRAAPGRRRPRVPYAWLIVGVFVLALAIVWVLVTRMHPAYDAYGWLVWGHHALHLDLNTNAAPSWKPLPFLFTFPFALTGRTALWLWMFTAVAAAFAAPVFAGRIAYRLAAPPTGRRYAAVIGALVAGVGVLGIAGYWHFVLIATADPMMVALTLAAIDCHLSGRPRAAWGLLVLTSLGRPEAWPLAGLYAIWAWRAVPSMRRLLVAGVAVIPLLWFGIAALTSRSPFIASEVDKASTLPLSGNRVDGTLNGFTSLYELPMQLAALVALAVAAVLGRRDRRWLILTAAAATWLAAEIALALHGEAPVPRYMFEPAAVMVTLAGAAIGRLLGAGGRLVLLRWLAVAGLAALVVTLVPHARIRARLAHNGIVLGRRWTRQIDRLDAVVTADGGVKRILACGNPVTEIPYQTIVAWELGRNVVNVGWIPSVWERKGKPMVLFEPHLAGWQVIPIHTHGAACKRLQRTTPSD